MTELAIFKSIAMMIAEQQTLPLGDIRLMSRLEADLGIDSLGLLDVLLSIDVLYDVSFEPAEAARLVTMGDLVDLVGMKLASATQA
jgi:acyl carrier protein